MKSEDKISYCAKRLPPGAEVGYKELDELKREWKNLALEDIPRDWYTDDQKYKPYDEHWSKTIENWDGNN